MAAATAGAKALTKSQLYDELAQQSELSKKQVADVFDSLENLIRSQLSKKGPGIVNLVGLLKIKKVEKPATKQRQGRNPLTGEAMTIKAKPKRTVIKVQALKALKDMI